MDQNELRPILRQKYPRDRTHLLPALHFVQGELGYLPEWALQVVGWHLRIPASEVFGAATSYSELRINSPGRHLVRVCSGLSCWHNGGRQLLEELEDHLAIQPENTNQDEGITLEETPCGFLCPVAPAVQVDGIWRGRVTAGDIIQQLQDLSRIPD
jgi:NADH:ubiquinone oxidoreductase subunit E